MKTDNYDSLIEQIEKVEDPDLKKNYMGVLTLIPKEEWEQFEQTQGEYLFSEMCKYSMEVNARIARDAMKADLGESSDNSDSEGAS